ncbi:hypothetical protein Pmar_PMAR000007, partial [Perkinsus marinus ATCC 50983]
MKPVELRQAAPPVSPAAEMLNVLGVPVDIGPCLVDWLTRDYLDRLELISKISESDWKSLIETNLALQEVDVGRDFPRLDPARAQAAKLFGLAMSDETRRVLEQGYAQTKAATASPDYGALNSVRTANATLGYISPDLLPDVRVLNNMIQSPAAYVEFKNLQSHASPMQGRQRSNASGPR